MSIILLTQHKDDISTRTYNSFNSMEDVVKYLTNLAKEDNIKNMKEFLDYVYSLYDFSLLKKSKKEAKYKLYGKDYFLSYLIKYIKE